MEGILFGKFHLDVAFLIECKVAVAAVGVGISHNYARNGTLKLIHNRESIGVDAGAIMEL